MGFDNSIEKATASLWIDFNSITFFGGGLLISSYIVNHWYLLLSLSSKKVKAPR